MSNFSEQREKKNEQKERNKLRREKMASFFYDSAKLVLAGVVIGGLSPVLTSSLEDVNYLVVGIGFGFTVALAWIANKILK